VTHTFGSAIPYTSTTDFIFYLYITAKPDDGRNFACFSTTGGAIYLIIEGYMGDCYLTIDSSVDSTPTAITLNTWHKVKIHADATAASSYIQIDDGVTSNTFTRASVNYDGINFGAPIFCGAGDAANFYIDVVAINTP
jgi:hypothetical protein